MGPRSSRVSLRGTRELEGLDEDRGREEVRERKGIQQGRDPKTHKTLYSGLVL